MAKDCQQKRKSRKQITFTTSKGRGGFELSANTDSAIFREVKRLAKLLADSERFGRVVSARDRESVKNLPSAVRNKFIQHGLIEGEKSEKVPTLALLLDKYIASRVDKSQAHHRFWHLPVMPVCVFLRKSGS